MKSIVKSSITLALVLLCFITNAQETQPENDVIYMKNGNIIKGTIISYQQSEGLTIQTAENYIWTVKMDDVQKIEREVSSPSLDYTNQSTIPGFINYSSLGILAGNGLNDNNAPFSILISNGVHFHPKLSLSLGTGIEFFSESYLPVFLDFRYHINTAKLSPYLGIQAGYSFALDKDANQLDYYYYEPKRPLGGYLVNPEAGFLISFQNRSAMYFSAGYRHQLLRYRERQFEEAYINQYLNRLSLRIGFIFR